MAKKIPSQAQAKHLAVSWAQNRASHVSEDYCFVTVAACIRNGWLKPNGNTGIWPSGKVYREYVITPTGIDALEGFLREQRLKAINITSAAQEEK